tara:strand:- start:424 stop:672 length:249 start_codon:yes stop_codon:yes gene_type:complete
MTSTFHIDLPNWLMESTTLKVIVDISPAEPDVGVMGNGRDSIEILEVFCDAEGYDPKENIRDLFGDDRIDDIAHLIYQQLER